jgi:hypothetical protein
MGQGIIKLIMPYRLGNNEIIKERIAESADMLIKASGKKGHYQWFDSFLYHPLGTITIELELDEWESKFKNWHRQLKQSLSTDELFERGLCIVMDDGKMERLRYRLLIVLLCMKRLRNLKFSIQSLWKT